MRDAVVRAAREHARKLLTRQRFQDLIREVADFAVDLVAALSEREREHKCKWGEDWRDAND